MMNMKFQVTISAILTLFLMSCSLVNTGGEEDPDQIPESAVTLSHQTVEMGTETIDQSQIGSYEFEEKTELVLENEAKFSAFWSKLHEQVSPTPDLPEVDFSEFIVVAAMMGIQPSGGYTIEIKRVATDGDTLWFDIEEREPGTGCGTAAVLTSPYHVIKVPRIEAENKIHRYITERIAVNCEN